MCKRNPDKEIEWILAWDHIINHRPILSYSDAVNCFTEAQSIKVPDEPADKIFKIWIQK
jgi:hypothetical protein